MTGYKLVIGNKNYSSWSLRAWLYLKQSNISFEEVRIPLFTPGWKEKILDLSPAGRVPVLLDGDLVVWDTLAIFEHVREQKPGAVNWPAALGARTHARCVVAEMHSGFTAIRDELPQNVRAYNPLDPNSLSETCRSQIERVMQIWTAARQNYASAGPFLYGKFSIADAVYAPVVLRFMTYGISLSPLVAEYANTICQLPAILQYKDDCREESEHLDFIDDLHPPGQTPLTQG